MPDTEALPIDHLVLPVRDLASAGDRMGRLGFIVAPTGRHPFGTENCCVYLADGTFLEPLAIANAEIVDRAILDGTTFVVLDRRFRGQAGQEGFSALSLRTGDARADHERFVADNSSAGAMTAFSRPTVDAQGKSDIASFELAFAADPDVPTAFCFTCQRVNVPNIDRSALQNHPNGVSGIRSITAVSDSPDEFAVWLANVGRSTVSAAAYGSHTVRLGQVAVTVMRPDVFQDRFGEVPAVQNAGFAAVGFVVTSIAATEAVLSSADITFAGNDGRLIVPPADGQGAWFTFEEIP